jgi:hypothetical protein
LVKGCGGAQRSGDGAVGLVVWPMGWMCPLIVSMRMMSPLWGFQSFDSQVRGLSAPAMRLGPSGADGVGIIVAEWLSLVYPVPGLSASAIRG